MSLSRGQGTTVDSNDEIGTNNLSRRTFLERALALGVGSSAMLTALNACGDSGSGGTNTSGPITLTSWDYYTGAGVPILQQRFDSFTRLHPSIKIQRSYIPYPDMNQKVLQGAAAGELPDLLLIDSLSNPTYSANG
ncbi:MAG: hypothetical protein JOZ18_01330, partial [Chloroflexi bacterium]|nr:hypothetical protein [Chloroflexota bacterium]